MKKRLFSLIALALVACMMLAMLVSCGGETETKAETKKETTAESNTETTKETEKETVKETEKETVKETVKETEKETEKETVKETVKETEKETEKETVKETVKETEKETESETERETVALETNVLIDGFKSADWEFTTHSTNLYGDTQDGGQNIAQKVWVDDESGSILARNRAGWMAVYQGEEFDLSYGFELKITMDWINTVAANSNYCRYWGNTIVIELGEFSFVVQNAYHEYYNGACPITFEIFEGLQFTNVDSGTWKNGDNELNDMYGRGDCLAECYTDVWAVNGVVNEEVVYYLNSEFVITYDGESISATCADGKETIMWELPDGTSSDKVEVSYKDFESCDFIIGKGWGGYKESMEGHAYFNNFSLVNYVPVEQ